jgi:LAO/AO transport system kinase
VGSKANKSALSVQAGIEQPPSFNDEAVKKILKTKPIKYSNAQLFKGILSGNITMLSKAITLVESALPEHQEQAQELIRKCLPYAGKSIRIGITGVPGVGKSTFIEALGKFLTESDKKIAVLAIDPSSLISKGSILGDKTRMEELSADKNAYIRPSPSAGTLGGVAQKTRETITLCEAAGYEIIFVETVGVGQSETLVHSMVDFFLLLMLAGAGDELQGIKRGIMEMADVIVINKADGDNVQKAKLAKAEYTNALHLFPPTESGWQPKVCMCSSREKTGIDELWNIIDCYCEYTRQNGYFHHKRTQQEISLMHHHLNEILLENFYNEPQITHKIEEVKLKILQQKSTAYQASAELTTLYFELLNKK